MATHYVYTAFGQVVSGDITLTRYLFTWREYNVDVGLQYNRARWYDAGGRWISEDPLGFAAGDVNTARYVGNGVVLNVDPSGLQRGAERTDALIVYDPDDRIDDPVGAGIAGATQVLESLGSLSPRNRPANGVDFEKFAKAMGHNDRIPSFPLNRQNTLIDLARAQYERNGNRPVTLYIVDHGTARSGQEVDDERLSDYRNRWRELGEHVDEIVLIGCFAGKNHVNCAELSKAIGGTVSANNGRVEYPPDGKVAPPFSDASWQKWRKGRLVNGAVKRSKDRK